MPMNLSLILVFTIVSKIRFPKYSTLGIHRNRVNPKDVIDDRTLFE